MPSLLTHLLPFTMPKDVAPALVDVLLDTFPARKPYTPADLQKDAMPKPIRHFLERRLQTAVREQKERIDLTHFAWADTLQPSLRDAQKAFRMSLERHAQIPESAWEKELTQAAHRVMHYLIRPVPTAIRFIYVNEEPSSLPAQQVLDRFAYFSPYAYLREAARAYISQRELDKVDRTRLATLLTRVDKQMTHDYSPEQWMRLVEPLYDLAEAAFDRAVVPADDLEQFFETKEQSSIVRRITTSPGMIDREELHSLLEADEKASESRSEPTRPQPQRMETPSNGPAPQSKPAEDDAVPLWKQFQQSSSKRTATAVAPEEPREESARPRWADFQPEPKEAPATLPLSELEQEIFGREASADRSRYIRELFNGSEDEYRRVLGALRDIDSWNEASKVIADKVFRKHQVNIYSDPAVSFTNAVEAGYK